MKIRIAENIRTLRKQHSYTQEQLAEALGVTVSAVYKWESGQSLPEVKMLTELCDLFEISVDTLLGYDRQNEKVENRIKRIQQYMTERDFDEAVLEAEKALKKYPNKFAVVYVAAYVYMCIYYEKEDEKSMQRSIELFYSSVSLLYQNEESSINEATILTEIGNMYIAAKQEDKGLELLKKNNICGINSSIIGLVLAKGERGEEAKEYLHQSFVEIMNNVFRAMLGMLHMYGTQKKVMYREVGEWLISYMDSLVENKEVITFFDRLKAIVLAQMALYAATCGNYEEAEQNITDAYNLAIEFDANPDYSFDVVKFFRGMSMSAIVTAGVGDTALAAIENYVFKEEKQSEALDFVKTKFEILKSIGTKLDRGAE